MLTQIKNYFASFYFAVASANEKIYLLLISFYVALNVWLKIAFTDKALPISETIRYTMLGIIMWGAALYLLFIIASWKNLKNGQVLLVGIALMGATGFFATKMSTNSFGVVFDVVFVILAYGKSFRKILKCILGVITGGLVLAGIGIPMRFSMDMQKPETDIPGHSLGINYPNTWAYIFFLALLILWYLNLRFNPILTFTIFWSAAVFNWYYIECRTIAGLALIFPILAFFIDSLERQVDKKRKAGTFKRRRVVEIVVIVIPFLALGFMLFNSFAIEWWYQFYHGPLRNLAWRFIQGGLYFKHWGMPIFGNPYRSNVYIYENVCGEFIKVGILDSSFAAYIIMRGLFWLSYTLIWLCVAHWKAIKKHDYAIILIEAIILGFAMMERPGLELWYNFVLFYPLSGNPSFMELTRKEVG